MAGMLLNMALGAGILFLVLSGWLLVQRWAREADHLPPDCDMLDRPERGCGRCQLHGKCDREPKSEDRDGK